MLTIDRGHFLDKRGRTVMLRGVNLGGSSKMPAIPSMPSHVREDFFDHAVSKLAVRDFIKELNVSQGTTVIVTTHDMDDIQALCSRVMLVAKGNILFDGTMEKLRKSYVSERRMTVDFLHAPRSIELNDQVAVIASNGNRLELSYNPQQVSVPQLVQKVSALGEIRDFTVEEPPIEEVIARVYGELKI